ncbi:hypothetical protein QBC47DRAFT_365217 [Echria macrotheca]|uniref:Uncharacterized protein n=1 Tax=Echria macrotheca TaxID=438768 RepID=A0AAJ0B2Z7_9PEZI|nr:hypothetical protein QBC47DRAFT_365217 [Echria macrotheca]
MCYQLVELYSACRCLYYQHAVDRCAAYGRPGHGIQRRTILVGYACSEHSSSRGASYYSDYAQAQYSDSGYHSGRSRHSPALSRFDFGAWVSYVYSFRTRSASLSQAPSQLSLLFMDQNRWMSSSAPPDIK